MSETANIKELLGTLSKMTEIIAGYNTIIAVAPAEFVAITDPLTLPAVGLVQDIRLNSGYGTNEIGEIGSRARTNVSIGRGQRVIELVKVITFNASLLYSLYNSIVHADINADIAAIDANDPEGKHWENLDNPRFKQPIGILLAHIDEGLVIDKWTWYTGVHVSNLSDTTAYGTVGLTQSVTLTAKDSEEGGV